MKPIRFASLAMMVLLFSFPAMARDQVPDVNDALKDWKAAVESASVDNVMKLYDRHAVMISTFAQDPMTKREQIAGYFKKVLTNPDLKVEIEDTHPRVFGTMAVNSGRYILSYTQDGEPISIPARFSFVYQLEGGKWMIVDLHSSRVPLPDDAK